MKKFILMLIALIAIKANVNAQVMSVVLKNGTQIEYNTNEIDHIEFLEENGTNSYFSIIGTWVVDFGNNETDTFTFLTDGTYIDIFYSPSDNYERVYEGKYTYTLGTLSLNEKTSDGYSLHVVKVKVVSNTKMIWTIEGDDFTVLRK